MNKANTNTNIERITVSVPNYVREFLLKSVPKRQVSQFVSEAIAEKIPEFIAKKKKIHPLREFFELRKKFVSRMTTEEIIEAIHKGRK